MSILDIFRTGPAPVAVPQAPAVPTPGNIPATAAVTTASTSTPATAPNGTVPATTDITGGKAESGLDQFKDLFNTDPNPAASGQPLFNITHDKVMESARKQDFKAMATPEQMAAITAGGAQAAEVMLEIMNTMAQNVYAQATFATTKLIEGGLDRGGYAKHSDIDTRIRSSSVNNNLRDTNPLFSHAAAQPLLAGLQSQLLQKFPNATPNEISKMAQDYLSSFADAAKGPQQTQEQQRNAPKSDDWTLFFQQ